MVKKTDRYSVGISLPKEFVSLIDKILKIHPDFKNRTGVIRYVIRKYYEETIMKKK